MAQTATQIAETGVKNNMKMSGRSYAGWVNAVLMPVKIHAFCCGVLPVAVSAFGGNIAGDLAHNENAQLAIGLATVPVVTFGVMAIEQKIRDRRTLRRAQKTRDIQHDAACACAPKSLTAKNFFKQTVLGYSLYAAAHFLWPDNHAHCDHAHHHEHPQAHHTEHVHDHGRGHACDLGSVSADDREKKIIYAPVLHPVPLL